MTSVLSALKNIPMLYNIPEAGLQKVLQMSLERNYSAGEDIFDQEDEGEMLYLLLSGAVSLEYSNPAGHERLLSYIYAPAILGEIAVLTHIPRTATVHCISDVQALVIYRDLFKQLIQEYPLVLWNLATILAHRLADTNRELSMKAFSTSEAWLAYILLTIYQQRLVGGVDHAKKFSMTQAELAKRSGNSRETVSRIMRRMEDAHIVILFKRQLHVVNIERLEAIAYGVEELE